MTRKVVPSAESQRLQEDSLRQANWKRWGPYLSERQWATVREDYSPHGDCWNHFSHDDARSRAYRWGEDGLLGITDRQCRLCFALALWNTRDPFLKERLFGGNSNWRGPIWLPVNYLLIEALERYHYFYGDSLRVECPTGSGRLMNLAEVAEELCSRLVKLFLPDGRNRRPFQGGAKENAPDADGLLLFHEHFHAETGAGLGASHQTGWTSLIADCLWKTAHGRPGR